MKSVHFEYIFLILFFSLLAYAGYFAYKSIDYQVLEKLEATPLTLPTQTP